MDGTDGREPQDVSPPAESKEAPEGDGDKDLDAFLEALTNEEPEKAPAPEPPPAEPSDEDKGGDGTPVSLSPGEGQRPDAPPPEVPADAPEAWNTPEGREFLQRWYAEQKAAEERQAQNQQLLDDVETKIKEGRHTELGEQFAEEYQRARARESAGGEAVSQVLGDTYRRLLSHPVFEKGLTAEEKGRLHVSNFGSPAEHIAALTGFIVEKEGTSRVEAEADKRVREKLEAKAKEKAGDKMRGHSPSSLPAASPEGQAPQAAADLLAEGLREAFLGKHDE